MPHIFFDRGLYPEEAQVLSDLSEVPDVAIFGIDLSAPAQAITALVRARRAGITCAVLPLLADPFEQTLSSILQKIASTPDIDAQTEQLIALRIDQLLVNDKHPVELAPLSEEHLNASALVLRLADLILLGAPGDRDRYNQLHRRLFRRFALLPAPAVSPARITFGAGITLYAPNTAERALDPYLAIVRGRHDDVRVISASNAGDTIVTKTVWTPEWRALRARKLAAAGHHVVAPNVFRVDECDSRIFGYNPVDYRSMLGALDAALVESRGDVRIISSPAMTEAAIANERPARNAGPRVSIIVRTFDRPALLERAIASIARQKYDDVEIVVVNNGGDDVRDIVERAAGGRPFVYERMPLRKTISAASNVGARAATGTYVGYLDDDDLLYADHCARAVEVLERSAADLVFTLCLGEYAEIRGEEKLVLGYQIYLDRQYHLDDIFISNITPIHTIVHPRTLFDRFGYFDENLPVTDDWELWLRVASRGGRFVRIDRTTCEYSWRFDPDRGNMTIEHQWNFVHAYDEITSRYADFVRGRASIQAQQANLKARQTKRAQDAEDPAMRSTVVISSMNEDIVPVAADWEKYGST